MDNESKSLVQVWDMKEAGYQKIKTLPTEKQIDEILKSSKKSVEDFNLKYKKKPA